MLLESDSTQAHLSTVCVVREGDGFALEIDLSSLEFNQFINEVILLNGGEVLTGETRFAEEFFQLLFIYPTEIRLLKKQDAHDLQRYCVEILRADFNGYIEKIEAWLETMSKAYEIDFIGLKRQISIAKKARSHGHRIRTLSASKMKINGPWQRRKGKRKAHFPQKPAQAHLNGHDRLRGMGEEVSLDPLGKLEDLVDRGSMEKWMTALETTTE